MNYEEFETRCRDLYTDAPNVDSFDIIDEVYTNLDWMDKDKAASMWKSFGIQPFKAMLPAARQSAEAYKVWQDKNLAAEAANAKAKLATDAACKAYDDWKKLQ